MVEVRILETIYVMLRTSLIDLKVELEYFAEHKAKSDKGSQQSSEVSESEGGQCVRELFRKVTLKIPHYKYKLNLDAKPNKSLQKKDHFFSFWREFVQSLKLKLQTDESTNQLIQVAVQGCLHGELDQVYSQLACVEQKVGQKFDLLIICGDFQSIRHQQDLEDMHCPQKYKQLGNFIEYFEGRKIAPILTVLIGGNHQAVNSFRESHFGGWLAPKIYFLGQAGSIFVIKGSKKLRITGLSGIYNQADFKYCTRLQNYPLRNKDRITAYHTKQLDVYRLELLARIVQMKKQQPQLYGQGSTNFDIMLSHDWPQDIALYGNVQQLFKIKPYFQKEIQNRQLGSGPMARLLKIAKPNYWFSAHMHVKYPAIYPHQQNEFTHFLSLDKCLGKRSCLQVLNFNQLQEIKNVQKSEDDEVLIEVDMVWIAVLLLTKQMMKGNQNLYYLDKLQVKLVDSKRMNELISAYPKMKQKLDKIGSFRFDSKKQQVEQTKELINRIGLAYQLFQGICLQRENNAKLQKNEDQIELDL